MPTSYEYYKQIGTGAPQALSAGMFGEQVSHYDGSTSFSVTDIDVPGNNTLPVRLTRRFSVESRPELTTTYDARYGGIGDWSIEVPFIASTYPTGTGEYEAQLRCSGASVPSTGMGEFLRPEFWSGIDVSIPGRGETKLLSMTAYSSVPRPTDGVIYNYTTSERDAIDCIPMKSGFAGTGYRVTTSSGVRYYFDTETIRKDSPLETVQFAGEGWVAIFGPGEARQVQQLSAYLMASRGLGLTEAWSFANSYLGTTDVPPEPAYTTDVHVLNDGNAQNFVPYIMQRNRYYLLPSRVEDRFGNSVTYEYNASGHPTRIASSDGREINLMYQGDRLVSASSNGRIWN